MPVGSEFKKEKITGPIKRTSSSSLIFSFFFFVDSHETHFSSLFPIYILRLAFLLVASPALWVYISMNLSIGRCSVLILKRKLSLTI